MEINISKDLKDEIDDIATSITFFNIETIISIALRLGINKWKEDPSIIVDMLKIGAAPPKKKKTRAPRKPPKINPEENIAPMTGPPNNERGF